MEKMKINRDNFEAFMLDLREGNLDRKGREALALFLEQNPDLKAHLSESADIRLQPDLSTTFEGKAALKKSEIQTTGKINEDNYEKWMIASMEGDLSPQEEQQLGEFLAVNPFLQQEISNFRATVVKADNSIVFPEKEKLKKKIPLINVYRPVAAAAVVLLLLGIFVLLEDQPANTKSRLVVSTHHTNVSTGNTERHQTEIFALRSIPSPVRIAVEANRYPSIQNRPSTIHDPAQLLSAAILPDAESVFSEKQETMEELPPLAIQTINGETPFVMINLIPRNEMSSIFNDMLVRDGLKTGRREKQNFMAGITNALFGKSHRDPSRSVLKNLAEKGKQSFEQLAEGLPVPVYSETDESGKKITYVALTDNISFRINKGKGNKE